MHATTLADRLRLARRLRGKSQRALAERAGLDPSHVRLIEEGLREDPRTSTSRALAEALDVPFEWFAAGTGPAPAELADSEGKAA